MIYLMNHPESGVSRTNKLSHVDHKKKLLLSIMLKALMKKRRILMTKRFKNDCIMPTNINSVFNFFTTYMFYIT